MADLSSQKATSKSKDTKSLPSVCTFSACHLICRADKGTIDDHFFCVTHSRDFYFNRVALENGAKVSDLATQGLGGEYEHQ